MDADGFLILSNQPGRIQVRLSRAAKSFIGMGLFRLRRMASVRTARLIMNNEAVEVEYDPSRSADELIGEIARDFGVDVGDGFLTSEVPMSGVDVVTEPVALVEDAPKQATALESFAKIDPLPTPDGKSGLRDGWSVRSRIPGRIRLYHPLLSTMETFRDAIHRRLASLPGVDTFKLRAITGTVLIEYAPPLITGEAVIEQVASAGAAALEEDSGRTQQEIVVERATSRLMTSSVALTLSVASLLVPVLRPFAAGLTAIAGTHIVASAGRSLVMERRLRVDVLDATVITVALAFQKILAAGFMVWVVDLSDALLAASSQTQRRNLAELFGKQARRAWRLNNGVEIECAVAELQVGDAIVIHAGERIPVDGEVVAGEATIDRSALTGEHAAVECVPGDRVFAMSVLLTGSLHVVVQQTGADTTAARMVQIVEESLEHKPQLQSLAERFAETMVVPTFGLGGVAYGIAGPGPMLAVINADFGTGIRVAGPLAMLSSLSAAARSGILIKKGQVLEDLGRMNAVVFDKTGTLTEDTPTLKRIFVGAPYELNQVLAWAAAAERRFSHPIAAAILNAAATRGLTVPDTEDAGYEVGLGVRVRVNGMALAVGSLRFMSQNGVAVASEAMAFTDEVHANGGTAVFVASGNDLLGVLELVAVARAEAAGLVRYLRETKKIDEIHLISGDHDVPVRLLAQQLGITSFRSGMLPKEKADYVRDLQAKGLRVAMFGDGVNDTAGLAQANYSISLRGASDVATDVADVVFLDGNLAKFPLLDTISANLTRNVKRSFALTLAPNSICIAGAMMGTFGLGASLIFNNLGNLVTVINGSRAQTGLDVNQRVETRQLQEA